LLEMAQAIDETAMVEKEKSKAPDSAKKKTEWRLAALARAGADFVVALPDDRQKSPEGWGTEVAQEIAGWMRQALDVSQRITQILQAGPLLHVEGGGLDHRIVVLPKEGKNFLVGWPAAKAPRLSEQSKQLVASWDS